MITSTITVAAWIKNKAVLGRVPLHVLVIWRVPLHRWGPKQEHKNIRVPLQRNLGRVASHVLGREVRVPPRSDFYTANMLRPTWAC